MRPKAAFQRRQQSAKSRHSTEHELIYLQYRTLRHVQPYLLNKLAKTTYA